tara:strand:- start:2059 stop:2229 length:171 start_codon:yes stop_codon:yes gene_type:complete
MAYKDWEALKTFVVALDDDEIDILLGIVEDLERDSSTIEGAIILGIVNQILNKVDS